jgi:hypothetical protein
MVKRLLLDPGRGLAYLLGACSHGHKRMRRSPARFDSGWRYRRASGSSTWAESLGEDAGALKWASVGIIDVLWVSTARAWRKRGDAGFFRLEDAPCDVSEGWKVGRVCRDVGA